MAIAEVILRLRDEVSAGLGKVAVGLRGVSDEARKTESATDDAGRQMGHLRDRADEVGDTASKLAAGLGLVSPEAQGLAMVFADGADAAIGLASAAKGLGVSMAAAGAALGIVVGVVTTVVAVVGSARREMELADQVADTWHQSNQALAQGMRALVDAQLDWAVASGQITEADAQRTATQLSAQRAVEDYAESIRDQRKALVETAEAAEGWAAMDSGLGWVDSLMGWSQEAKAARAQIEILDQSVMSFAATVKATARVQEETITLEEKGKTLQGQATVAVDRRAEAMQFLAEAQAIVQRGLTEEQRAVAEAEQALTGFIDRMRELGVTSQQVGPALEQLAAELDAAMQAQTFTEELAAAQAELEAWVPAVDRGRGALATFYEAMDGLVPADTLNELERMELAVWALTDAFEAGEVSPEAYAAALERMQGVQVQLGAAQQVERAEGVAGALGTVAGGPEAMVSALAMAGPQGMIASTIIQLIDAIGDGLLTSVVDYATGLLTSLDALVPELVGFLEQVLTVVLPQALTTVAALVDDVLLVLLPAIVALVLDPGLWFAVGKALALAVASIVMTVFEGLLRLVGTIVNLWQTFADAAEKLLSADFWRDAGQAVAEAIREWLSPESREARQDARRDRIHDRRAEGRTIGAWLDEGFVGSFASGTQYVPRDGLAMVHRGERIERAGRADVRGKGGGTIINIGGGGLILGTPATIRDAVHRGLRRGRTTWET